MKGFGVGLDRLYRDFMEMLKVSVIVPVYRVEKYIDRCLDSLVGQTLRDMEIICICEKSDSSYERIREWQSKDKRIILVEKKNEGVSSARNAGIEAAKGEYIAFVDADDWVERHAFDSLYKSIKSNSADILVFGMYPNVEPRGAKRGMFGYFTKEDAKFINNSMIALFYQHGSRPYIGNKMYLRTFLIDNDIRFDEQLKVGEDQLFQFAAFSRARIVCYVREKFYHYDISRSDSAMNRCSKEDAVRKANFLLLHRIMEWKARELPGKWDPDFTWWMLQDYAGWLVGAGKQEQMKYAGELSGELLKLDGGIYVEGMPAMYQDMYHFVELCAGGQYQASFYYDYKEADHYMDQQTRPVKEPMEMCRKPIRRIREAIRFHEFRHFMTRVWIRMGNDY